MIQLQITGRHYDLDNKIVKYVNTKIGMLDKYVPRQARGGNGQVVLQLDASHTEDSGCVCEVNLEFPGHKFHAREGTLNMYAAIDICEAKLKAQILKYKDKHTPGRNRGRLLFGKMFGREPIPSPELTEE